MAAITYRVSVAWWLRFYLYGVCLTSMLTGLEPDWVKVERVVMSAIRLRIT